MNNELIVVLLIKLSHHSLFCYQGSDKFTIMKSPLIEPSKKPSETLSQDQKLKTIQDNVDQIGIIVRDNLEKVLERGEKINVTRQRTEDLKNNSERFRITAKKLRFKICRENAKMSVLIAFIICAVIAFVSLLIYDETK